MSSDFSPGVLWLDLRLSLAFFSRVPLAPRGRLPEGASARALRLAPLAGALIGLVAAAVYGGAGALGDMICRRCAMPSGTPSLNIAQKSCHPIA